MFNKKKSLFLITLVFMLSLSAVGAVDTNSSDDMATGDVEEEPPSGSYVKISTINQENITANEPDYILSSNDVDMYYKNGTKYEVTLSQGDSPVSNVSVVLNLNGVNYTRVTDEKGVASLIIGLNVGSYDVSASFNNLTVENQVNVLPLINAKDISFIYGNSGKYTANFLDSQGNPLKNANVEFIINGKTYTKKTDSNGVASMAIGLKSGKYVIYAIHPDGYKISNTITINPSVAASNLVKYYGGSAKFSAKFYNKNGKVLANKKVKFIAHGKTFQATTNSKGVAYLSIVSKPSSFEVYSLNPVTNEKISNTVKVLSTLSASNIHTFSYVGETFTITLHDKNTGKVIANKKIKLKINGASKTVKTNSKGVASVSVKFTSKGTYKIISTDPNTGYSQNNYVYVKWSTLKANAMYVNERSVQTFKVTLTDQNKKAVSNGKVQITINGVTNTVKTNSKGVASINFKLNGGTYYFISKDLSTGYTIKTKVYVFESSTGKSYNKYGVSEDGKTILAIGRPSASGELSKYGYNFYVTEFLRECPYCHSDELYWGIFWAGDEYSNYGIFPATGHGEGGSAEGHIFCAHCDSDWSVFGHNHGGSGGDLTVVSGPASSTKADAYALKSGNYVYP